MTVLKKIKDKMYYNLVEKNPIIKTTYQEYVNIDPAYHKKHRLKSWYFMLSLNMAYSGKKYFVKETILEPVIHKDSAPKAPKETPVETPKEKMNALRLLISSSQTKIVSFDLFDTLLIRPVVEPKNLFSIIAKRAGLSREFIEKRCLAETIANRKCPNDLKRVKLYDIYNEYQALFNSGQEFTEKLMQIEMDVEYDYLYPRQSVKQLYEYAYEMGKDIIIISDMYLPKDFIDKLLEKNGYNLHSKVYISCEIGLSKRSGRLFSYVADCYKKRGINSQQILHIGDNYSVDIEKAKENGLNSFHIPAPIEIFKSKKRFRYYINKLRGSTDNSFVIGYLANYLFDDYGNLYNSDSHFDGRAEYLGAVLYAPLLLALSKWMLDDLLKNNVDKLLLSYRDGYMPEKIIEIFSDCYETLPKTESIYLSRKIRYFFNLSNEENFSNALIDSPVPKEMTVETFIKERMGLSDKGEVDKILEIFKSHGYYKKTTLMGELKEYIEIIPALSKYYLKNGRSKTEIIKNYCIDKIGNAENIAIFDVGNRGATSRFLLDNLGVKNIGYQLFATPQNYEYERLNLNYTLKPLFSYSYAYFYKHPILHTLTELVISKQEGTSKDISFSNGFFHIEKEKLYKSCEVIDLIQGSVLDFIQDFVNLFHKDFKEMTFDGKMFFEILSDFIANPNKKDAALIYNINFNDSAFLEEIANKTALQRWAKTFFKDMEKNLQTNQALKPVDFEIMNNSAHHTLIKSLNCFNGLDEAEKDTLLVVGGVFHPDKGIPHYLNKLNLVLREKFNMITIVEAVRIPDKIINSKFHIPSSKVANYLDKKFVMTKYNVETTNEIINTIHKTPYLLWAYENMKDSFVRPIGYIENVVYYAQEYFEKAIEITKPKAVILWNQFSPLHYIYNAICKKHHIKVLYLEFGSFPGTLSIEKIGQMGESYPAQFSEEFKSLNVTKEELNKAKEILTFLKKSKLNRNVQPINDKKDLLIKNINNGKPIIFYAGQNDFESGLYPYTENANKYHSPIFKTSNEALKFLTDLSVKNEWNLIYKPHPLTANFNIHDNISSPNLHVATDIDINDAIDISDVVITILSQVSYISLIREKPMILLGYTQLYNKGCCYEVYEKEIIEQEILNAIKNGYTDLQKNMFVKHAAQMLRYNLYDDLRENDMNYGQNIKKAADFILNSVYKKDRGESDE